MYLNPPLGVSEVEHFSFDIRYRGGIHEFHRRFSRLIRVIDRPQDIFNTQRLDGKIQREMGFLATGGNDKILLEVFTGFALELGGKAVGLGPEAHEVDAPEPELHGLAHVPEADPEAGEAVEYPTQDHTDSMGPDLHAVGPQ